MLHRVKKAHDVNQDKWIGVGGKFEGQESPDECLLREVREETGLTLTDYRFRGVVTFLTDGGWEGEHMYLFTATGWTGELSFDCLEGELKWVPKEKVTSLPIWEGDKIFLGLLAQNYPAFLLTLEYAGGNLIRAVLDGKEQLNLSVAEQTVTVKAIFLQKEKLDKHTRTQYSPFEESCLRSVCESASVWLEGDDLGGIDEKGAEKASDLERSTVEIAGDVE